MGFSPTLPLDTPSVSTVAEEVSADRRKGPVGEAVEGEAVEDGGVQARGLVAPPEWGTWAQQEEGSVARGHEAGQAGVGALGMHGAGPEPVPYGGWQAGQSFSLAEVSGLPAAQQGSVAAPAVAVRPMTGEESGGESGDEGEDVQGVRERVAQEERKDLETGPGKPREHCTSWRHWPLVIGVTMSLIGMVCLGCVLGYCLGCSASKERQWAHGSHLYVACVYADCVPNICMHAQVLFNLGLTYGFTKLGDQAGTLLPSAYLKVRCVLVCAGALLKVRCTCYPTPLPVLAGPALTCTHHVYARATCC